MHHKGESQQPLQINSFAGDAKRQFRVVKRKRVPNIRLLLNYKEGQMAICDYGLFDHREFKFDETNLYLN